MPIKGESERPQLASEVLSLLSTWFAEEAERLSGVRSLDRYRLDPLISVL
jgi:hypothetical protein